MRAGLRRSRSGVSGPRHAGAGLAFASLLTLFLSQPFHQPPPTCAADAALAFAAAPVDPAGESSTPVAHDADRCAQCRAFAKTRLGLRPPSAGPLATDQPLLSLHWPPPAPPSAAAELRLTRPRAPPLA
jgi:hypothetical protein